MKLKGRIALVTGSGQGIGLATLKAFGAEGATLIVSDVVAERAAAAAKELTDAGYQADNVRIDVGDKASIEAGFAEVVERHGRLDIFVNNAAISSATPFLDVTHEEFERMVRVNLTGAFLCAQAAARQMVKQAPLAGVRPKIVNICSISGQRGGRGRTAYGATKAGLDLITRVMTTELAGRGLNVNAIAPGPIETEMAQSVHHGGQREAYLFLTSQGRYGEAGEIAKAALFLCSDDADYINGVTLNVDGGFGSQGLQYPLPG
ncbi:SDR family NAD(P)-dependent oxidoreductase [Enterovirga rhinocerotis]|uniref:NAD(P)-dependent dehydrogenase (Short-subunit alcohol dehydrogenase family) n=1 Tax=Enterovirga rhinocerotis TaxID=1339210 RepID=A0A4R7C652_9HYPH|nr:SDR family oxidoreductase [Enterovirga rhinocerotis]TDR93392.1 NAD(P)-dependent dehydrogenase (short-subunit alcohol dehydrogenase family) [Enterovirga rhinocerotis]